MISSIPEGTMVFKGNPLAVIKKILKTGKVSEIYLNRDYTPFAEAFQDSLEAFCEALGVALHLSHEATLLPPGTIKTTTGDFFKKFTPFKEKFLSEYRNKTPTEAPNFSPGELPEELGYTIAGESSTRDAGESGTRATALELLHNVSAPDPEELLVNTTSSGMSPYLKLGIISVREVYSVFKKKKLDSLIEGLVWREFYYNIAVGFPGVLCGMLPVGNTVGNTAGTSMGTPARNLPFRKEIKWWYTKPTDKPFILWTQGKTGFPVVDACMRQLSSTGELCGRGRMIVGSFLTKILFVDWRLGEQWFAQNLLDYDPILNNGNWQWVAGCGVDVQPYIRIFNPTTQGLKHDPEGDFARKWLPELRKLTVEEIYSEEKASRAIVDYKKRRVIAMKLFRE